MKMVAPGKARIRWAQSNLVETGSYGYTNSWENAEAAAEASRPAMDLLWQAASYPGIDFQLDYKKGDAVSMAHLMPMKRAAQVLEGATVLNLHHGDSGATATNILTLLALVDKDRGDELLISHSVRLIITDAAVAPTWELLQATNVTDAQLAAVQNGWEQMNFLRDAEDTFMMERALTALEIQKTRGSHEGFKYGWTNYVRGSGSSSSGSGGWAGTVEDFTQGPRMAVSEAMWRSSWSYSAELHDLKIDQAIVEILRTMQTNRSGFYKADYDAMTSRLSSLGFTNPGEAFFSALKIPDFRGTMWDWNIGSLIGRALRTETARDVVVTAIALKRFQLKHGKRPETLNELTPEFLLSVPIDPYDGKPLKYHPNADDTFLLYAVGENGVDDGGDPMTGIAGFFSWQDRRARDWVWPQPATPAEVQDFYEHPPK
jgi:hypothetical protein